MLNSPATPAGPVEGPGAPGCAGCEGSELASLHQTQASRAAETGEIRTPLPLSESLVRHLVPPFTSHWRSRINGGVVLLSHPWPWSRGAGTLGAASAEPVAGLMGDWFALPPSTPAPSWAAALGALSSVRHSLPGAGALACSRRLRGQRLSTLLRQTSLTLVPVPRGSEVAVCHLCSHLAALGSFLLAALV